MIDIELDALIDRLLAEPKFVARVRDIVLMQPFIFGDPKRLHISEGAVVNNALFNLSSGEIHVGEWAFFGHNVNVLTGTHDTHKFDRERQTSIPGEGRDVHIEKGAWIASGATLIGPCRIGEHAVVGAGSLVVEDVPPYTVVVGMPAKPIRQIEREAV